MAEPPDQLTLSQPGGADYAPPPHFSWPPQIFRPSAITDPITKMGVAHTLSLCL